MKRVIVAMFVLSATGALVGQGGQSASSTLDAAATALGAPNLTSIYYSGRGSTFNFGQAVSATAPWPRQVLKTFEADIHLTTPAMRMQAYRTNPDGTAPFGGFLQQQYVSENLAWNLATFEDGPQPPGAAPAGGGPGGPGGPARAGGPPAGGPPPAGAPRVDLPRPVRRQQARRRRVGLRQRVDKVALAPPVAPHAAAVAVVAAAEVRRAFLSLRPRRPIVARRSG